MNGGLTPPRGRDCAAGKPIERRCGNMDTREYELMYIVRPTVAEDQFPDITERVDGMVANLGGVVSEKNPWGKRRLAYPIEKHEDGYYVVSRIRLDPSRTH